MANEVGRLELPIEARVRELERDLRSAERKVKQSADRMQKAGGFKFGGKLVEGAARATAAMGAVELGIKGAAAAAELVNGNFEKANELIKQLPAGIGPVAQAIEQVVFAVTDLGDKLEEMQKRQKAFDDLASRTAARRRGFEATARQADAVFRRERNLEDVRTSDLPELTKLQQERAKIVGDISSKLAELNEAIAVGVTKLTPQRDQLREALRLAEARFERERDAIIKSEISRREQRKADERAAKTALANAAQLVQQTFGFAAGRVFKDPAGGGGREPANFRGEFRQVTARTAAGVLSNRPSEKPATERTTRELARLLADLVRQGRAGEAGRVIAGN